MKFHIFLSVILLLDADPLLDQDPLLPPGASQVPIRKNSPYKTVEKFTGTLVPFTLSTEGECYENWECLGPLDTGRDSCGTYEDPCAARLRGDVGGDSIFMFHHPDLPQTGALDGHTCGATYKLRYGSTNKGSIYIFLADIQPGYMDIKTFDPPDSSPWKDRQEYMPEHWDKYAEVHNFLEIEKLGWTLLQPTPPVWDKPCRSPIDFSLPEDLPEPIPFSADIKTHRPENRLHNFDLEYTSKSLVRWANYMRAFLGEIPPMLEWDAHLSEVGRENAELFASGNRRDPSFGWDERKTEAEADGVLHEHIIEFREHHKCANCARTMVKWNTRSASRLMDWLMPYTYLGVACENKRASRDIDRFCNMLLASNKPSNTAGWAPLWWDDPHDWPEVPKFTSTTTQPPLCHEAFNNDGISLQIHIDANKEAEVWHDEVFGAWASILSQWQWWQEPHPEAVEVWKWPWMNYFCASLHLYQDKDTSPSGEIGMACHKVLVSAAFHNRDPILTAMQNIEYIAGGDDENSIMDTMRRGARTWWCWGMDRTQFIFAFTPYHSSGDRSDMIPPLNSDEVCDTSDYGTAESVHYALKQYDSWDSPVHVVIFTTEELEPHYQQLTDDLMNVGRRSTTVTIENDRVNIANHIWEAHAIVRCWCADHLCPDRQDPEDPDVPETHKV